jgi:hypothetical protein
MKVVRQQFLDIVSTDKLVRQVAYEVFASSKEKRDVLEVVARMLTAELAYSKAKKPNKT